MFIFQNNYLTIKFYIMNTENNLVAGFEPLEEAQLVQQFQVEELEKRYEFGWGPSTASTSVSYTQSSGVTATASATWKF
jgi:hypothetical protein